MKALQYLKTALLATVVLFSACSKDDEPGNPTATAGFKWRENSTTATEKTAGYSELRTQYKSIFSFEGTAATPGTTLFEINLTGVTPATYDLATSGNSFYFKDMATGSPVTGKVVITANSGGKASGTFEAFTGGSGITKVYGTFTDIPVK
ncbi:MAG: hypothetical protein ACK5NK_04265 [Niabella sp.]